MPIMLGQNQRVNTWQNKHETNAKMLKETNALNAEG